MAQEVTIAGATYSSVPSILVPDSNNVFHPFIDPSITTAVASDVASGKIFFAADGTQTTGTASGGGSSIVYEEGTWEPSSDIARGSVSFSDSHSLPPWLIVLADTTGTAHSTTYTNFTWVYFDYYRLFGTGVPYSASGFRYASIYYNYRQTSTSSITQSGAITSNNSDDTGTSNTNYPRYWATPSLFRPYTNSTSRYWRAGRTYKWFAIWK